MKFDVTFVSPEMRFSLLTLLIVATISPPVLGAAWWAARWIAKNPGTAFLITIFVMAYLLAVCLAVNAKRILRRFSKLL